MSTVILIIDDDEVVRDSLRDLMNNKHLRSVGAANGQEARTLIEEYETSGHKIAVILLDYRLPDVTGFRLLEELQQRLPFAIIILMTAFGNVEQAVEAMRRGVFDYVSKPFNTDEFHIKVLKAIEVHQLKNQVSGLTQQLEDQVNQQVVKGNNTSMGRLYREVEKIAKSPSSTVLLSGETGTGKEVLAQYIHSLSQRRPYPFVAINCAALSAELLESELFGHEEGAFTGATGQKKGLFELANGGTLFLDEIGELPLLMQGKMLRALQEKKIRRVGGSKLIPVNIRIIAATNRHLPDEIEQKNFREDLYYRLAVVTLHVLPLRERLEDMTALLTHFIEYFNREFGRNIRSVHSSVLEVLRNHSWPGNIRELRNVVERSMLLECGDSTEFQLEHLRLIEGLVLKPVPSFSSENSIKNITSSPTKIEKIGHDIPLDLIEKEHILGVLKNQNGNKSITAQILGIDRSTLYNKMTRYGIGEQECDLDSGKESLHLEKKHLKDDDQNKNNGEMRRLRRVIPKK